MERTASISDAKELMGRNFIGSHELSLIDGKMGFVVPSIIPDIPFRTSELIYKSKDYILILGLTQMKNGNPITIKTLRTHFGIDDKISEPCFYNQDWYINEEFFNRSLEFKWYLIRKNVFEDSRGINPVEYKNNSGLPSAIQCAFVFFSYYFIYSKELLWKNDYIWTSDIDSNGDMIYVGRYIDKSRFSKNGFSIHRHLKIRNNYGIVDYF